MTHKLNTIALIITGLALVGCHSITPLNQAAPDLSWNQVHLAGMHLSLISPTKPGESLDLEFSEKYVAMDSCVKGYCTGPVNVWKIEGNRLKIGNVTDGGYALISVSQSKLVLSDKDGKVYTYAIVQR
jgi:hypothetical protein